MKYRICYLYMEIRKTFRIMPRMALQAVLLMTVMGLVVAVGAGSMKSDPLAVSVDIAVAVEEDNVMTRMALRYVENMESVSRFCHFQQVTKEEGSRMLEKGQVAAVILLPEQLVEGIMNGTNPAVTICFPKNAGLETMLFRELTRAGEGLLRAAPVIRRLNMDLVSQYRRWKRRLTVIIWLLHWTGWHCLRLRTCLSLVR